MIWGHPGMNLETLGWSGAIWRRSGRIWGDGNVLGWSEVILGLSWDDLGTLWGDLETFWGDLEGDLGTLWGDLGTLWCVGNKKHVRWRYIRSKTFVWRLDCCRGNILQWLASAWRQEKHLCIDKWNYYELLLCILILIKEETSLCHILRHKEIYSDSNSHNWGTFICQNVSSSFLSIILIDLRRIHEGPSGHIERPKCHRMYTPYAKWALQKLSGVC